MTTKQQLADLEPYLDGMRAAETPEALEKAFQRDTMYMRFGYNSRGMKLIDKVRVEAGVKLCEAHPNGWFVPRYGPNRRLEVCGETYRVGRGGNSTGVRYAWAYAESWAIGHMVRNGLSLKAAHSVWSSFRDYPHRALLTVVEGLAGKLPDPELNVLIRHRRSGGGRPISYSVEENERCHNERASRPCPCGGTLFDWGGGHSAGFEFINWHCIKCPDVFTEYMTRAQFYALRAGRQREAA